MCRLWFCNILCIVFILTHNSNKKDTVLKRLFYCQTLAIMSNHDNSHCYTLSLYHFMLLSSLFRCILYIFNNPQVPFSIERLLKVAMDTIQVAT